MKSRGSLYLYALSDRLMDCSNHCDMASSYINFEVPSFIIYPLIKSYQNHFSHKARPNHAYLHRIYATFHSFLLQHRKSLSLWDAFQVASSRPFKIKYLARLNISLPAQYLIDGRCKNDDFLALLAPNNSVLSYQTPLVQYCIVLCLSLPGNHLKDGRIRSVAPFRYPISDLEVDRISLELVSI